MDIHKIVLLTGSAAEHEGMQNYINQLEAEIDRLHALNDNLQRRLNRAQSIAAEIEQRCAAMIAKGKDEHDHIG